MTSVAEPGGLTWLPARVSDPLVRPMLRELGDEYSARYGKDAHGELARYPEQEFEAPHGLLLLLLEHGEPVAGGAFRRYDAATAELKRIWTHSAHRRRGLALRVVGELERIAAARGYRRIHLTTGPRQPEARGLYLTAGYTPLFDTGADPETIGPLPFTKDLAPRRDRTGRHEEPTDHRPAVTSAAPAARKEED
ncbi:GNAT family N-acetyltransferase [Streptomyces sp. NPDC012623]|uniref:GNAT family N-acetyltransferase n=1 Tax=unclassified Streptomyces TaxID=2593676 RepID=UPI0036985DB6